MTEDDRTLSKCAVKYCRERVAIPHKYCTKHELMQSDEILDEEKKMVTIHLQERTVKKLVVYALESLAEELKEGKGN